MAAAHPQAAGHRDPDPGRAAAGRAPASSAARLAGRSPRCAETGGACLALAALRLDAGNAADRLGDAVGRRLSGDAERFAAAAADLPDQPGRVRRAASPAQLVRDAAVPDVSRTHGCRAVSRADPPRRGVVEHASWRKEGRGDRADGSDRARDRAGHSALMTTDGPRIPRPVARLFCSIQVGCGMRPAPGRRRPLRQCVAAACEALLARTLAPEWFCSSIAERICTAILCSPGFLLPKWASKYSTVSLRPGRG